MKTEELTAYEISPNVLDRLVQLGFVELTEVQRLAVLAGLFKGKNLLVSAPTNTGKTFVGELASLNTCQRKTRNRTFFLVPLRALAEEMFGEFKKRYGEWGLKIAISTADRAEFDEELENFELIIATYEKLNALLVRRPQLLNEIGLVVFDELQNIVDTTRGPTLEILLTTLITALDPPQVIGLSATISNASDMAKWLGAELVLTSKRDVELREGILNNGEKTFRFQGLEVAPGDFIYREFSSGKTNIEKNLRLDHIEKIAQLAQSEQIIVFANTRYEAERIARIIADGSTETEGALEIAQQLEDLVESTPSTRNLRRTLQNGVAFHHAGLLPEERSLIEEGFRSEKIRVISSTPTLGAGVNTPAKNVVFLSHKTYQDRNIATASYKNMAGRAGRIQEKDNFGRSILLAENSKELEMLWKEYVIARPEPVESRLGKSSRIDTLLLGLIATGVCQTLSDVTAFMKGTFFGYTQSLSSGGTLQSHFETVLKDVLRGLHSNGFLEVDGDVLRVTELGRRCAEELLSPRTVALLYRVFNENVQRLNDANEREKLIEPLIHLAVCSEDGRSALLYGPRSEAEKEELQAIYEKYRDNYLYEPADTTAFFEQFRTTRMLVRWIDGVSYHGLSQYGLQGVIKKTAETISWILKGMRRLTEKPLMEVSDDFRRFLYGLSERVNYGVQYDAVQIMRMRIPGIGRTKAVQLANAGFKTVDDLVLANHDDLQNVSSIGPKLALRIKEHAEKFISVEQIRLQQSQVRRALETKHDPNLLKRLYKELGSNFARAFIDILKEMKLNAMYVGDVAGTDVDGLVKTKEGTIVIEGKRKEAGNISAKEAEEVRGKGARHNPIAYVTIGYPDFAEEAQENAKHTGTTLLRAHIIGEALVSYWERKFSGEDMINILKSRRYLSALRDVVNPKSIVSH